MERESLKALVHEMEYVLACINQDKIPFDGDDFHEALRLGKEALAQPEQEPVAWAVIGDGKFGKYELGQTFVDYEATNTYWENRGYELVPVYTNLPKQQNNV
jgi:hypothetical protein